MPQTIKNINFARCLTDFPYYAQNMLHIKNKDSNLVPFKLWEPQLMLDQILNKQAAENKLQRVIVLKARQEGISTYSEGRIFHGAHFTENTKNVIIAHEKQSGQGIFGMCRLYYDCLPKHLRPMTKYSTKQELVFENPDKKTSYQNPGLRSSLEVFTAGKKSVARGVTIHKLHCSELASWTFAQDVVPALMPTVPKTPQSLIILESTAKGMGNYFHNEWKRAKEGKSNFYPYFVPWFALSSYMYNFSSEADKRAFAEHLNDEEKALIKQFNITLEQLYWRRISIAELGGDVELFRQENPATDTEAFIISGTPMFNRKKLRLLRMKCSDPIYRGYFTADNKLVPDSHGELKVWKSREKGGLYTIGVDVSDGAGGDYSCIEVWKKLKNPFVAEQVAEWHGYIDPHALGGVVRLVAMLYNEPLVAVEVNSHGLATQQELQRNYWNLYRQERFDRLGVMLTKKVGWETDIHTKKLLIAFMSHCITDMSIIVHSDLLIDEATSFVRDSLQGSASAAGTGYDDRIMAAMIGLFVMFQSIDEEPLESVKIHTTTSPIDTLPSAHIIDREFAEIIEYGSGDMYDNSWLNY